MTTIREDRQHRLYPGLHDQAAAPPPPAKKAPRPAKKAAPKRKPAAAQAAPPPPPVAPRPAVSRTGYVKQIRDIIARHRSSYGGISGMYIPSMTQDLIALFDEIAGTGRQIDDLRRAAEEQTIGHSRSDWNDPLAAEREDTP